MKLRFYNLLFLLLFSLTIKAQFLAPFYSVLQSNRGIGTGKLNYRIYSSNTTTYFPSSESDFRTYINTYNTYKAGGTVSLAAKNGAINTVGNSNPNILNFSGSSDLYTALGTTSPYSGYTGDGFTLVASGYFTPKQTGTYKFSIEGDDAVDLIINGVNVVNHYNGHGAATVGTHTGSIYLIAGKKYTFRARFQEAAGGEAMFLFWQKPSESSGSVWYQDVEELSSDLGVPNGLVMAYDIANFATYPEAGATFYDLKGNANGNIVGNVTYNTGNNGNFYFDGDQDYIDFGTNPANFPTGNMSMFMWVYSGNLRGPWNILLTKWFSNTAGDGINSDFHYAIKWNGANYRQNLYTTNNHDMYGAANFNNNTWYFIGFTLTNGGSMQFYVNGVADGTVQTGVSRTYYSSNSVLYMGDPRLTSGLPGNVANLAIYNRALSAGEVLQNYNAHKHRYGF